MRKDLLKTKKILVNIIGYLQAHEITGYDAAEMAECIEYINRLKKTVEGALNGNRKSNKDKSEDN